MDKAYEAKKFESDIYAAWEASGFFNPDNLTGEPYAIMMPPPNVTGILHLGHALENTLMDVMARYQRMQGKKVLLLSGTDHAAVATQARVENDLVEQGIKNPRQHFGREELLKKIREYAEESKATILTQIKKIGTSADWSRLAYTFDEERSRAVNTAFQKMYQDGLVYSGYRAVNWSIKGQSTCSDDELKYIERPAKLYTFKYSKDFPISIATTRPETKLGDTAVAVNPKDERYKKYIGKKYSIKQFGGAVDLIIKIIGDETVDPGFGTGAVGVTPAHSMVDFEMNEKHDIGCIQVIDRYGRMTSFAGKAYEGQTVDEAHNKVVDWLQNNNLLEDVKDTIQNVGTSDRFGDVVEVLLMTQWFVAVNKEIPGRGKSLKYLMREVVVSGHTGDAAQRVKINPERFEKVYLQWIDHLRDWCISRQIWWGHQIPVWYELKPEEYQKYKDDSEAFRNFLNFTRPATLAVGLEKPSGDNWLQDPDTLDTWFSSGLWTFSTLGWGSNERMWKKMRAFHPTSWMQMGHEIIFFWMARMILMSTYLLDEIPFHDVYIHGMVRDEQGRKFSKSLKNGIDPLEVIEKYGADALRLSSIIGTSPGADSRFYYEKLDGARNFVNKLWNIARYILDSQKTAEKTRKQLTLADSWILERLEATIYMVNRCLEEYDFASAMDATFGLREFMWDDLADWYLEISKVEGINVDVSNKILETLLKLLHPFLPFVTEVIWKEMKKPNLLMVADWPNRGESLNLSQINVDFSLVKEIITAVRSLRADKGVEPAKKIKAVVNAGKQKKFLAEQAEIIKALARLSDLEFSATKPAQAAAAVAGGVEVYLPLAELLDIGKEKERLQKEIAEIERYRDSLSGKLVNKEFTAKAPKAVVAAEQAKLTEAEAKLKKLREQLI